MLQVESQDYSREASGCRIRAFFVRLYMDSLQLERETKVRLWLAALASGSRKETARTKDEGVGARGPFPDTRARSPSPCSGFGRYSIRGKDTPLKDPIRFRFNLFRYIVADFHRIHPIIQLGFKSSIKVTSCFLEQGQLRPV